MLKIINYTSNDSAPIGPAARGITCCNWPDGCQVWYMDSIMHRTDGPAFIRNINNPSSQVYWYVDGLAYRNNKEYKEASGISDEDMVAMVIKYGNVK